MTFNSYVILDKAEGRVIRSYEDTRIRKRHPFHTDAYVHYELQEGDYAEGLMWNGSEVVRDPEFVWVDPENLRLRIRDYIPRGDLLKSDFTIVGLKKKSPNYERGKKTRATYVDPDSEDLVVEKIFEDIRDSSGTLIGTSVTFNWYSQIDEVGLTKTEQVREYNVAEAETEERKRRERQIDYLVANAKGTPIEAHVDTVFVRYYAEVESYKAKGTLELDVAIDNETDPAILSILAIMVPQTNDPAKLISVAQSIKYQIGTMTLEEINEENE